jgi:PhzF family phenazine biosynthesis protein
MRIPLYQIDAFANAVFAGNPAAVCPLDRWLDDSVMQSIAAENNLAETAFFVPSNGGYELRWFTPTIEMELCGHATLASAFVVFEYLDRARTEVTFQSKSGALTVWREDRRLAMDFPAEPPQPVTPPAALEPALGARPIETLRSRDYLAVFDSVEQVLALSPRMDRLMELDARGVIATARGRDVDFVSRFFAPKAGVPEDPVTGSAHCALIPFWAKRLGRTRLEARQLSERGGEISCELRGDRVRMTGGAVLYLEGSIHVEDSPTGR